MKEAATDQSGEPYQTELGFTTPDGFSEETAEFTVPAGKRLVIEQVSATATPPAGQVIRFFSLRITVGGASVRHSLPAQFNGFADFVTCQHGRFYADAGSLVKFSAPRNVGTGEFQTTAAMTGYLVPEP